MQFKKNGKYLKIKNNPFDKFIFNHKQPILLVTAEEKIFNCNEPLCELFGLSHEEVIKFTLKELCNLRKLEPFSCSSLLNGNSQNMVFQHSNKQQKIIQWNGTLINDDKKGTILITGIDISELTRMVSKAQKIQASIINLIPDHYILWKDKNLVYLGCNQALATSLGLNSPDEIIGKTDYDLPTIKEQSDDYRADDLEVISSGEPKLGIEEYQTLNNGMEKILLTSKIPFFDETGRVDGVVAIYSDITQRKKMEEELHRLKNAAQEAKAEFLRNMEHQLRTPFSGVYSLVHMLANEEPDPKKKELLEVIYTSGKELLDFLNDVISFSRNPTETTAILAKKFDLKELIERAINMERPAAVIKELDLKFDYPKKLPTIFISDPKRIQRIVLNLLSNAIKFTVRGSVNVSVKLGKQIDEKNYILSIIVTDTGIGITEDNQSLIYEKFHRVSPANQNKYQGAGLGLHIVKELIADLEGEIEVMSQLNEGSTFICTLPLKRPLIDEIIAEDETAQKRIF